MELTEYEKDRELRVQKNKAQLESLGILTALNRIELHKKESIQCSKRVRIQTEEPHPRRRSQRQLGVKVESGDAGPGEREGADGSVVKQERSLQRPFLCSTSNMSTEPCDYNDLNKFRLHTMSEKALRLRISKIRNVAKLKSFIQVLESQEMADLAQEARQALQLLLDPE
ncbi:hypothetical protein CEUSTIGMA_g3677.t1 [Chlamydomonas eustigma]|uniref:Uncharacterized protein n=1 Tax=Chlamydomonas eustigma TaxID=1157962 RepID=A0A250WZG2_9CHLO|nr:hypothetical protein CEUSTIGMA_g3677.t1 [Chlamydomonas eustigma]|eukprot:GAX76233.1 hypothetical protein CEUSTIGMA_g3677.t1 [Chlamydomonas eustigma]